MKTFTVSVDDDVYQRAGQKAAAAATSLSEVVQNLLWAWAQNDRGSNQVTAVQQHADFLKFLDELAARPLKPGPSLGPLDREGLYQRGVSGY